MKKGRKKIKYEPVKPRRWFPPPDEILKNQFVADESHKTTSDVFDLIVPKKEWEGKHLRVVTEFDYDGCFYSDDSPTTITTISIGTFMDIKNPHYNYMLRQYKKAEKQYERDMVQYKKDLKAYKEYLVEQSKPLKENE
jgi:hypothetical protein